jgi:hypothetical protein
MVLVPFRRRAVVITTTTTTATITTTTTIIIIEQPRYVVPSLLQRRQRARVGVTTRLRFFAGDLRACPAVELCTQKRNNAWLREVPVYAFRGVRLRLLANIEQPLATLSAA